MNKFRPFDYLTESEKIEVNRLEALSKATSNIHDFKEFDKIIKQYLQLARIRKEIIDLQAELKEFENKDSEEFENDGSDEEDSTKAELLATCT